jgi:hypothetical protein
MEDLVVLLMLRKAKFARILLSALNITGSRLGNKRKARYKIFKRTKGQGLPLGAFHASHKKLNQQD